MSRYIFSKNNRWYISEVFDPSDSKIQEKASYYTLTDDVTGPYYAVGTSDSASIGVSYVPVVEPAGAIEAGYINAEGNFQPLSFDGTQASDSGSAVSGLQHKIFNTGHDEPDYGGTSGGAAMEFYKCSYVNSNSWGGYKALFNGQYYYFQSNSTQGLLYSSFRPIQSGIYSEQCNVKVGRLIPSAQIPTQDLVFYASLSTDASNAQTGQVLYPIRLAQDAPMLTTAQIFGIPCRVTLGRNVGKDGLKSTFIKVNQTQKYTLSVWVLLSFYNTQSSNYQYFCQIGNSSGSRMQFYMFPSENSYKVFACYTTLDSGSMIQIKPFKWYHLCLVISENDRKLYCNGNLLNTDSLPSGFTVSPEIYIFTRNDLNYSVQQGAALSSLRLYNRALSQTQITNLAREFTPTA